ncbi:MAG: HD domain-containing protein [Desulfonatronovibrio sp.]
MNDYERFKAFFDDYVHKFIQSAGNDTNLILKKDHSYQVAEQARLIAESEDFPGGLVFLCRLAGLFHDIGRFEQYRQYKTFKDSESVNHAGLGFRIITAESVFDSLSKDQKKNLRLAVLFHSRNKIPLGLPSATASLCNVLRDADKLDIYHIMLSHLTPEKAANEVVTLGLDKEDLISPEILDQVSQGRLCQYSAMRYENDFKLLLCSWVYDLNYDYSREFVIKNKFLDQLFELLPSVSDINKLKTQIMDHLSRSSS